MFVSLATSPLGNAQQQQYLWRYVVMSRRPWGIVRALFGWFAWYDLSSRASEFPRRYSHRQPVLKRPSLDVGLTRADHEIGLIDYSGGIPAC